MSAIDSVLILTGGTSRRMGVDKADSAFGSGRTLLGYVYAGMGTDRKILIAGPEREYPALYFREDPPGAGPVAAIAAALEKVELRNSAVIAVIAVDTPFGIQWLLKQELDEGSDALIPRDVNDREHYLCALYRCSSLHAAIDQLPTVANASMRDLISHFDVIKFADNPHTEDLSSAEVLLDINTPADLELAHSIRERLNMSSVRTS